MSRRTIRVWLFVHEWTSLVCTAFMLLLCITGLPLIFAHEIDHALGRVPEPPAHPTGEGSGDVDALVADAEARKPGHVVQFVVRDPEEPDVLYLRLGETIAAQELSAFYAYDTRDGRFLGAYPFDEGVMTVLYRLHVDIFAGLPGTLFLGFMGLLLVASIISGVVLYGPYMRKRAFGTVRRERSRRLAWLDLHNLLGITTLVWLLVVGATGVVNTLAAPLFRHWQQTELADMMAPHAAPSGMEPGSPQRAMDALREGAPDLELSFMAFPGNAFAGPSHYVAYMQGNTPWTSRMLVPLLVDARTGSVVGRRGRPWYMTVLLASQPLHFGDYGGLPLKVIWALLDGLSIVVLVSGLYLWVARRRSRREGRLRLAEDA